MRLLISALLFLTSSAQESDQNCGDLLVLAPFCATINGTISKRSVTQNMNISIRFELTINWILSPRGLTFSSVRRGLFASTTETKLLERHFHSATIL